MMVEQPVCALVLAVGPQRTASCLQQLMCSATTLCGNVLHAVCSTANRSTHLRAALLARRCSLCPAKASTRGPSACQQHVSLTVCIGAAQWLHGQVLASRCNMKSTATITQSGFAAPFELLFGSRGKISALSLVSHHCNGVLSSIMRGNAHRSRDWDPDLVAQAGLLSIQHPLQALPACVSVQVNRSAKLLLAVQGCIDNCQASASMRLPATDNIAGIHCSQTGTAMATQQPLSFGSVTYRLRKQCAPLVVTQGDVRG